MSIQVHDPQTENLHLLTEWERWLERNRYAASTVSGYMLTARKFLNAFPGVPVEKLTAEHIEEHLARQSYGNASYSTVVERLRAFFKYLQKHKRLIRTNPCAAIEPPPVRDGLPHILMPDEWSRLCRVARELRDLVMLHLLYYSGLRINELVHVRVGDLDFERRLLRVRVGKGSRRSGPRERWTVLHRESLPIIKAYMWAMLRIHPDLFLLWTHRGARPISVTALRCRFNALRVAAGLPPDITPHSLRHGMVRCCKMAGISIDVTAALVGHDSIKVTQKIYGRLAPTDLVAIYEQAMFPPPTKGSVV